MVEHAMTVGARLKAWRKEHGDISQGDAAKLVGASQPAWSDWENDVTQPRIEWIKRLVDITKSSRKFRVTFEMFGPVSHKRQGTAAE